MNERPDAELFDRAVEAQPAPFERAGVLAWFRDHAPWVDPLWIEGRLMADTVNDRGRQHTPGPRDVLFGRADGRYEHYDAAIHGWWSKTGRYLPDGPARLSVTALVPSSPPQGGQRGVWRHRKAG